MKNRGFTLIELLAVIVILAIIALIATPIVLNIIKDSKKQGEQRSAELYLNAVDMAMARANMYGEIKSRGCRVREDGNLKCGDTIVEVDVNGEKPTGGTIVFSNGKILLVVRLKYSDGRSYNLKNGKLVLNESSSDASCFEYSSETIADYETINEDECKTAVIISIINLGSDLDFLDSSESIEALNNVCASKESLNEYRQILDGLDSELIEYEALTGVATTPLTGAIITGYACDETDIVIPSKLGGKNVTEIKSSAFSDRGLTSVVIPNTVTKIGDFAFHNNHLESVVIPDSVTEIGDDTFSYNNISELTLGSGVETIGPNAFAVNQITSVTIPNSVTTINIMAFSHNQLTNLVLGNSVTTIDKAAFVYNKLTEVTIPNSVTKIGKEAFGCGTATNTVGDTEMTYGSNALTKVTLVGRNSTEEIDEYGSGVFCWVSGKSDANINE